MNYTLLFREASHIRYAREHREAHSDWWPRLRFRKDLVRSFLIRTLGRILQSSSTLPHDDQHPPLSVISFNRSLSSLPGTAYRRPTQRRSVVFLACETVLERWNASNNGLATDTVGA